MVVYNGKPYEQMQDLGGFPYFWFNTQIAIAMGGLKSSEIREVDLWVCWIGGWPGLPRCILVG